MRAQYAAAERHEPDRLAVRTVPADDPGDLVACLPHPEVVAWLRGGDGLVGWGEAARLTLPAGADRFTAGEKWLRELFDARGGDRRGQRARLGARRVRQLHL